MDTHILNTEKKRLEPSVNDICIYCGKEHSLGMDDISYVKMYKEVDRTNVIVYRNVKFKYIQIGVPICQKCKNAHKAVKIKSYVAFTVTLLTLMALLVLGGFYLINHSPIVGIIVMLVVIFAFAFMANRMFKFFEKKFLERYNILNEREGALKYDITQTLLQDGYSFDAPVA